MKKYQLPKEFAEKWVAALRVKLEEKHHKGELRNIKNPTCYCGIGIGFIANDLGITMDGMNLLVDGKSVDYWNGFIFPSGFASEFVDLNDMKRLTFNELADWLEQTCDFI